MQNGSDKELKNLYLLCLFLYFIFRPPTLKLVYFLLIYLNHRCIVYLFSLTVSCSLISFTNYHFSSKFSYERIIHFVSSSTIRRNFWASLKMSSLILHYKCLLWPYRFMSVARYYNCVCTWNKVAWFCFSVVFYLYIFCINV